MKPKICIAMSGGVDSSTAACILKNQGYDVFGVFMKLWDDTSRERGCCSLDDYLDALRVAENIGIPFYTLNLKDCFRKFVVNYFRDEYLRGRTPNPCVLCNSKLKFDVLLAQARTFGATHIATGHYARILQRENGWSLRKGVDDTKDQTYFLFDIPKERLGSVMFPLGELTKKEVRDIASRAGLKTAEKKESQEICFVNKDYRDFLRESGVQEKKGSIVNSKGKKLGEHTGYFNFTIGQRSGLNIALGHPVYVLRTIPEENLVVVGKDEELYGTKFIVEQCNLLEELDMNKRYQIKVRYKHKGDLGRINLSVPCSSSREYLVEFDAPQRGITPGQAAVFYDGDIVVGGGWIREVL